MKVILLPLLLLIYIPGLLFFSTSDMIVEEPDFGGNVSSEVEDFQTALIEMANSDGNFPIEGYDADLLIGKFDVLEEKHFDRVETFEGVYSFDGENLEYERTSDGPISTAEKTVSPIGFGTLLMNLKEDFGVDTVDEVLEKLK